MEFPYKSSNSGPVGTVGALGGNDFIPTPRSIFFLNFRNGRLLAARVHPISVINYLHNRKCRLWQAHDTRLQMRVISKLPGFLLQK